MYFGKISINNYKNIKNEISIDFQSQIKDQSVENTFVMENKDISILNKIGLMGKNGIGKSNLFSAIYLLSYINKIKFNDLIEEEIPFIKSKIINDLKYIYLNIELLTDEFVVNYEFNKFYEKFTFSTYHGVKNYEVDINVLRTILNDENMLFSDVTFRDIKNLIQNYKQKNIIEPIEIQNEIKLKSLLKVFNVDFKEKAKHLEFKQEYTNEMFDNSLVRKTFVTFNKVRLLNMENTFFSNGSITELDINKKTLLKFLLNNEEIFKKIYTILKQLDNDIDNFKIKKESEVIKITFTKNNLDFFNCSSSGTKKIFGMLSYLFYWSTKSSLILFDELDATLNSFVIYQLLKLKYWNDHQLVFSFHNSNILNRSFNVLKADQIVFMRYEENSKNKEIVALSDFKNYLKYKRNNKLMFHILDNIFSTEPDFNEEFNEVI